MDNSDHNQVGFQWFKQFTEHDMMLIQLQLLIRGQSSECEPTAHDPRREKIRGWSDSPAMVKLGVKNCFDFPKVEHLSLSP